MMNNLFLSIICVCVYIVVSSSCCQWNTKCPYKYLSSKTPYDFVRGDIRDSKVNLEGCEPISIWGIIRHGKRFPSNYFGSNMRQASVLRNYVVESYEKGKSSLCAQDIDNLRNWHIDYDMFERRGNLTEEGYKEMIDLGRRLKQAFPKLLTKLKKGSYTLRAGYGDHLRYSIAGFVKGLDEEGLKIEEAIPGYDILAPYATCGKYVRDVKHNEHTYDEMYRYINTSDYLQAKNRIERRTGLSGLTHDNITGLYDLCRYTSNVVKMSPWCVFFTKEDLEVLEYIGDLRHYYRNSYGYPLNEKLGHIPLADLLRSLKLAKEGKGREITAYVSHATMLDMIYVALDLFHDEHPLTAAERNPNRKLRTSISSAFSANLLVVLNKCGDNDVDYKVVFYLNEEPIKELCRKGVCTWKEFEEKLSPFLNTTIDFCEFQTISEYVGSSVHNKTL